MKTTLLIMAAGIGSRFGQGVKQLAPVGLRDEIIMDYSIHDALAAGFNKIIFVIRRDIEADFRERIGNRVEKICQGLGVEIGYAFQTLEDIPVPVPEGRKKPWGTGQAVLAAREQLHEPFMVINADDYYGKQAYRNMHDWLTREHGETAVAMAGFVLKNTLSENGGVTRGICLGQPGSAWITDVLETKNIVRTPVGVEADGVSLDPESCVSMNMWGFPAKPGCAPDFLGVLEEGFAAFFRELEDPLKGEYLLPIFIGGRLRRGECTVEVLPTQDRWFGVTYKEDIPFVMDSFRQLIAAGQYAQELYSDL